MTDILKISLLGVLLFTLTSCAIAPKQSTESNVQLEQEFRPLFLNSSLKHPIQAGKGFSYYFSEKTLNSPESSGFLPLSDPMDAFSARLFLIDNARETIDIQYYLFHNGDTTSILIDHILQAANRGVKVRILLDDLDIASKDKILSMTNLHPNIEIKLFNPIYFRKVLRNWSLVFNMDTLGRRMHNKSLTADGLATIIGGRNIGDEYYAADDGRLFLDFDLMSVGPFAKEVEYQFDVYWQSDWAVAIDQLAKYKFEREDFKESLEAYDSLLESKNVLETRQKLAKTPFSKRFQKTEGSHYLDVFYARPKFYFDPPKKVGAQMDHNKTISGQIGSSINVEKEIMIVSPYFIPSPQTIKDFEQWIRQGIKVTVITNSMASTDVAVVYSGYREYRDALLQMGVHLYELRPRVIINEHPHSVNPREQHLSLHTKLMLIDGRYLVAGSANMDPRSKQLNTELVAILDQPVLAQQTQTQIEKVLNGHYVYKLAWDPIPESEKANAYEDYGVAWHYLEDGKPKVAYHSPETSLWRKFSVGFMSLFPIEGLL
jgi:putative cardiolipin synthase